MEPSGSVTTRRRRGSARSRTECYSPTEMCQLHASVDAMGSTRLGALFLTLPTRLLTGQHVIPAGG